MMVLARVPAGVYIDAGSEFLEHAADQAVYAVIFLLSPEGDAAQHLRVLAQVAQHVDDERFMKDWLAADSEQKLKEILLRDDRYLSVRLREGSAASEMVGKALRELDLPEGSLIALIHRAGKMTVPSGSTVLKEDDRLTIVGQPESIQQLKERFKKN